MIQNYDFWSEFREKKLNFFLKLFKIISFSKFRPKTKLLIMNFFSKFFKEYAYQFGLYISKIEKVISFSNWKINHFFEKNAFELQHTMPFRCKFENGCGHNFGYSWNFYIL